MRRIITSIAATALLLASLAACGGESSGALDFCDTTSVMRLGEIVTRSGAEGLTESELKAA